MIKDNIFDKIDIDKKRENFFEILNSKHIKIEKIVSNGQKSPDDFWYDQDQNEFILVLEGYAILELKINGLIEEITLKKGDYLDIKARVLHRVKYTQENNPTIWLAVFYE